jgi:beta-glucosidase/6-phospho-beta-glucosidase/beta-galactosidase
VIEAGDEQILAEGKVDYIGFSYYMSNAVKADVFNDTSANDDGSGRGNRYKKKSFEWYKNVIASNGDTPILNIIRQLYSLLRLFKYIFCANIEERVATMTME